MPMERDCQKILQNHLIMMADVKAKTWVTNSSSRLTRKPIKKLSDAQIRLGAANAIFVNVIRNWPKIWLSTRMNGMNLNTLLKAVLAEKRLVLEPNHRLNFKNAVVIDLIFL